MNKIINGISTNRLRLFICFFELILKVILCNEIFIIMFGKNIGNQSYLVGFSIYSFNKYLLSI